MGSAGSEAIKFFGGETRRGLEPLENDLLQTVGLTESGELDTDQASSSSSSSGTGLEGGAELISSYPLIYRGKKNGCLPINQTTKIGQKSLDGYIPDYRTQKTEKSFSLKYH